MTEPQNPHDPIELAGVGSIDLIELAGGTRKLPTEICLFKSGTTETTKGQFLCDATAAKFTIDNVRAHYGEALTNFDYGHGQMGFIQTAETSKSAGWAKLAERDGALWATDIEWTPAAQRALLDREFRFFSPTVYRDPETKRITNLVNVALTNIPATKGQRPIVTSLLGAPMAEQQKSAPSAAETPKAEPTDLAALQASNAQLLSAVSQLQASLNQAQTELSAVAAERAKASKASFIAKLSQDGKLPPALQPWALGQDLAVLEAFAKDAPVLAPASAETITPKVPAVGAASLALTDDEKKIIAASQISEADYLATRAHLLSSGNPWAFNPLNMATPSVPASKEGK